MITKEFPHDILLVIKTLINTRDTWTQYAFARNLTGQSVPPADPTACQWCLLGAITKICATQFQVYWVIWYLEDVMHAQATPWQGYLPAICPSFANLNDFGGFDAVHAVLDAAIAEWKPHEHSVS